MCVRMFNEERTTSVGNVGDNFQMEITNIVLKEKF